MAKAKAKQPITINEEVLQEMSDLFLRGYSAQKIKSKFIHDKKIRYDEWETYKNAIKENLTSASDIYEAIGRSVQLVRLNDLLVHAHRNDDFRLILDINKELDRVLNLYTQKLQVETTTYELEI